MSVSFMIMMSIVYIAMLFAATMYNHHKKQKTLFIGSAFALAVYVVTHLGNTLWLSKLPLEEQIATHYLYFAAMQVILAVGLFVTSRNEMRVIMSLTIGLLAMEVLLGYMVHIDRNEVALNGAAIPNFAGESAWLLWDLRDWISQLTTATILLALTLPPIYQLSKDLLNTEAFEIWEDVEKYLAKFTPSKRIERANVFMEVALKNMFESKNNERDKLITSIGIAILNEAIRESCYEPKRTKPVSLFGRFVYWLRS